MKRILLALSLQVVAFWEVGRWYLTRAAYSWDQPWGLLAFVAGAIVVYIATYFILPPLGRATIAFTALALTLSSLRFGRPFHPGMIGCVFMKGFTASLARVGP